MAITKDQVLARLPELERFTNEAQWAAILEVAALQVNRNVLGNLADEATIQLVGHLLTSSEAAADGAQIQSETVGPVTTTYAVASAAPSSSDLDSTGYGREFRRLVRIRAGGFRSSRW